MAAVTNLNGIFEALCTVPKLQGTPKIARRAPNIFHDEKDGARDNPVQVTRRLAMGLATVVVFGSASIGASRAEDNGFWLTGPIPVPYAKNDLNNKETGTRSFLKKGIYIANVGTKGRMMRLKRYAFDLIALGDLIAQQDAWNYVRRYLRLKSTFMYFDFDEVISAVPEDDKKPLTDLANRFFDNVEELLVAVREEDFTQTQSCYQGTTSILEEIMSRMG